MKCVRLLLEFVGDPNRPMGSEDGNRALAQAANAGHTAIVTLLLEAKADPDGRDANGITALMASAVRLPGKSGFKRSRYDQIVTLLLERGAQVDAVDHKGQTALIRATDESACSVTTDSYRFYFTVVRTLVEVGNADLNIKDHAGRSALDYSLVSDYAELPEYFRQHGAKRGADV